MRLIKSLSLILLTSAGVAASAQTFEVDGINYNVLSEAEGTVEVANGNYSGDVVIPASVAYNDRKYAVTTVGDHAFYTCRSLMSVSMPSITTIGNTAFGSCASLTSVSMPSVTTIGDRAFIDCSSLVSVNMPSVTTIGEMAFYYCYALSTVDMLSVETIGNSAFVCCYPLSSVEMPSVTTINDEAFSGCYALSSVTMPLVETIGDGAFNFCYDLAYVYLPASCTSIDGNPFDCCHSLEGIVVDGNNPNYSSADGVLYDKDKTTLISWPTATGAIDLLSSVRIIGNHAFSGCTELVSVSMPSVTTIGSGAFNGCFNLASLSIPSVETISEFAFNTCQALTSFYIPASCTTIGTNPFMRCCSLQEIIVDDNNPNYTSLDGALYDKDMKTFVSCPGVKTSINLPASVEEVKGYAFYECAALTSVSMPSVRTIGDMSFWFCSALASIDMPAVTTIGVSAFALCNNLLTISMPSLDTIGEYAFNNCENLLTVSIPSATTIGAWSFGGCRALTTIDMPAVATIGGSAFFDCVSLATVDFPASVTSIDIDAFAYCDGLTSVYCHWEEPLECDPRFTDETLMNAILYVPVGTIDTYSKTYPWLNFLNIEEGNYSGIDGTPGSEVTVKVIDGAIVVEGGDGTASTLVVEVYSAGGVCVYRGTDSSIGGLGRGVYVVKVGDTVQKVAL